MKTAQSGLGSAASLVRGVGLWFAGLILATLLLAGPVVLIIEGWALAEPRLPRQLVLALSNDWVWGSALRVFGFWAVVALAYYLPKTYLAHKPRELKQRRWLAFTYGSGVLLVLGASIGLGNILKWRAGAYAGAVSTFLILLPPVVMGVAAGVRETRYKYSSAEYLVRLQEERAGDVWYREFIRSRNPPPGPASQRKAGQIYEHGLELYYRGEEALAMYAFKDALAILIDRQGTDDEEPEPERTGLSGYQELAAEMHYKDGLKLYLAGDKEAALWEYSEALRILIDREEP